MLEWSGGSDERHSICSLSFKLGLARLPDGPAAARSLREHGVLVKDVGKMHPVLHNCLRFTVGTPEENAALTAALAIVLHAPS